MFAHSNNKCVLEATLSPWRHQRVQTFHFRWTTSNGFDGCLCVEAGLWKPRFHHEEINAFKHFICDEHSLAVSMDACALNQDTGPILHSHDVCNLGKCLHIQTATQNMEALLSPWGNQRVQTFHFRWTTSSGFDGCLCVEAGHKTHPTIAWRL